MQPNQIYIVGKVSKKYRKDAIVRLLHCCVAQLRMMLLLLLLLYLFVLQVNKSNTSIMLTDMAKSAQN